MCIIFIVVTKITDIFKKYYWIILHCLLIYSNEMFSIKHYLSIKVPRTFARFASCWRWISYLYIKIHVKLNNYSLWQKKRNQVFYIFICFPLSESMPLKLLLNNLSIQSIRVGDFSSLQLILFLVHCRDRHRTILAAILPLNVLNNLLWFRGDLVIDTDQSWIYSQCLVDGKLGSTVRLRYMLIKYAEAAFDALFTILLFNSLLAANIDDLLAFGCDFLNVLCWI